MIKRKGIFFRGLSLVTMVGLMSAGMSLTAFADDSINAVDTVDSKSLGVEISLYDYCGPANLGGVYVSGDGSIQQGLLSNILGEDGYPVVKQNNLSLKEWYSEDGRGIQAAYTDCNNLFLKDKYDSEGILYYSSFENYAWLDTSTSKSTSFKVYDKLGTPSNGNSFFYKRGNFLPFNNICPESISTNTNQYDKDGNKLSESDARYNEKLYLTHDTNYYFGMNMTTGFVMTKDGQYNGKDMVFEFNGDDDLWVYIDDILVLDIGGIHDAHSGSINFATGEIEEDTSSQTRIRKNNTTIKQRFIDATDADEKTVKEIFGDTDTFIGNTEHVLKVFYMERGQGASNCAIKFNLATIAEEEVEQEEVIEEVKEELLEESKIPEPLPEEKAEDVPVVLEDEPLQLEDETNNEETPEVKEDITENTTPVDDSPKTGDISGVIVMVVSLLTSVVVISVILIGNYKRSKL